MDVKYTINIFVTPMINQRIEIGNVSEHRDEVRKHNAIKY
jgi:hypothetical protein